MTSTLTYSGSVELVLALIPLATELPLGIVLVLLPLAIEDMSKLVFGDFGCTPSCSFNRRFSSASRLSSCLSFSQVSAEFLSCDGKLSICELALVYFAAYRSASAWA